MEQLYKRLVDKLTSRLIIEVKQHMFNGETHRVGLNLNILEF